MSKFRYTYLVYLNEPKSSLCGCIYYGQHTTDNLNDGYIGSGKILCDYLKKYPNGYYRKILNFYNTQEELNKAEYALIHPHLGKPYCLNLTEGGGMRAFPGELHPMYNKHLPDETKNKISNTLKEKYSNGEIIAVSFWKDKHLPDETKNKISVNTSKALKGNPKCGWSKGLVNRYNDNTLNKMSEARKKYWETHEHKSPIKGKHKVWDNKELNKYHYEY